MFWYLTKPSILILKFRAMSSAAPCKGVSCTFGIPKGSTTVAPLLTHMTLLLKRVELRVANVSDVPTNNANTVVLPSRLHVDV